MNLFREDSSVEVKSHFYDTQFQKRLFENNG